MLRSQLDNANEITIAHLPGLFYQSDFLDSDEETRLIAEVDRQPWQTELRRRVQHYGYRYDYKRRTVDSTLFLGPLPDWSNGFINRIIDSGVLLARPDQIIVNEYQPGQGIAPHVDCVPCFLEDIVSVSMGSGCIMTFQTLDSNFSTELFLEPRSLLLLQGEARYSWTHGIPARRTDPFKGERVRRSRRISLTLRKVVLSEGREKVARA